MGLLYLKGLVLTPLSFLVWLLEEEHPWVNAKILLKDRVIGKLEDEPFV